MQAWLRKAQRDLKAAQKLAKDLPDIAIYHCQQGAEKALKGFLILHERDSGDTHNINSLVQMAAEIKPEFRTELKEAGYLSQYNQTYRYPREATDDFNPTSGELNKAFQLAQQVYQSVLQAMPEEVIGRKQAPSLEEAKSQKENLEHKLPRP